MTTQFEKVTQQFNGLEVPPTQRLTTGPEESFEIGKLRSEYFDRITASLELSKRALAAFFCVEYHVLGFEDPGGNVRATDDFDASFWLSEIQPLASVRNVRDTSNFQVILFAKYPLVPSSEQYLRWIVDADSKV